MKKVCNRKDCAHAGVPQEEEMFYRDRRNVDKKSNTCIVCIRKAANKKSAEIRKDREFAGIV